jgi:hypothetical protein
MGEAQLNPRLFQYGCDLITFKAQDSKWRGGALPPCRQRTDASPLLARLSANHSAKLISCSADITGSFK